MLKWESNPRPIRFSHGVNNSTYTHNTANNFSACKKALENINFIKLDDSVFREANTFLMEMKIQPHESPGFIYTLN